jgi:hypothetical protein
MENRPKWLQGLIDFLVDNLITLLTIGFATYIIIRQGINKQAFQTNDLLTALLAVVGLLATSELLERYRKLNSIDTSNKRVLAMMESRFTDRPSAIAFFQKPDSLESQFKGAQQIDMCGVTLTSTINKQFSNIRELIRRGGRIRILIIDPNSLAPAMSAARSEATEDVGYYQKRIAATFEDLKFLNRSYQSGELFNEKSSRGCLEIKLLGYAPSFGLVSFNKNRSNGEIVVEIYPHMSGYSSAPTFNLTPHRDGEWYKYFVEQFDEMWELGKPWQPMENLGNV